MRILMVCPELPRPGRPGTMAPAAYQIQSLRDFGLSIDVVDMRGVAKLKYLQRLPRIRCLARQADVIHAHFGYCAWSARIASFLSGVQAPLIISFMGDDLLGTPANAAGDLEWFSRLMVRANKTLARQANLVIVKSREMAEVIAPVPSTVIPNGVDLQRFRPIDRTSSRNRLGWDPERKTVLFPGDPDNPRKGFSLAAAAIALAERELGQPINLVPLRSIAPGRVAPYMNACDLMLMTSLVEGSPNVVKEALACNLPVVAVSVGDVPELLEDVSGCAVCPRDPSALSERIAAWLRQPGTVGGRDALMRRSLDLASVARRITAAYEQVTGQRIPNSRGSPTPEPTPVPAHPPSPPENML